VSDEVLTAVSGRVLVITLNRPMSKNAVDTPLAQGLIAAAERLDSDPELTVGVILGNGKDFCSGMDVKAFAKAGPPKGFLEFLMEGTRKPLIAGIEGFAIGAGLELALACDLVVAARDVEFRVSEVRVGLIAAGGTLLRLPRRVPYTVAMDLALTADPLSSEDAHRYGLVSRLVEPGAAADEALHLARRIGKNAPLAVEASKQLIRAQQDLTEAEYWTFQRPHTKRVFSSVDAKEGAAAFAGRREPKWTGR
jgi:enoyl-CoA hydratase